MLAARVSLATMHTLADAAREALDRHAGATSIESIWRRAALEMVLSGRLVDPPIEGVGPPPTAATAFAGGPAWPVELWWHRTAALHASHRLAIEVGDGRWLAQLYEAWEADPEDLTH